MNSTVYQPLAQTPMDVGDKPSAQRCSCSAERGMCNHLEKQDEPLLHAHAHEACHRRRRRCLLRLGAAAGILTALALFAYLVHLTVEWESMLGFAVDAADGGIWKRQSNGTSGNGQQGVFVKNKRTFCQTSYFRGIED